VRLHGKNLRALPVPGAQGGPGARIPDGVPDPLRLPQPRQWPVGEAWLDPFVDHGLAGRSEARALARQGLEAVGAEPRLKILREPRPGCPVALRGQSAAVAIAPPPGAEAEGAAL